MAVLSEMGNIPVVAWNKFVCPMSHCNFECDTGRNLFHHFQGIHAEDVSFVSDCLHTANCVFQRNSFKTLSALKKHLQKFHGDFFSNQQIPEQHEQNLGFQEEHFGSIPPSPDQSNVDRNEINAEISGGEN